MNDTDERCIACRQDSAAARIVAAAEGFVLHDVRVRSALTCSRHHHVRARIYLPTDDAITETLPDGVRKWTSTRVEFRSPGVSHSLRFSAASRLLVIQVEPWRYEKLAPLFARHLGGTSMTTAGQRSVALRLLEAVMSDPHIAAVLVPGLIMEMIARAAMVQRNASAVPPLVMETMSFIEEHLSEPITLRRVSQCLGVAQGTLARSFRASTGEYLNAHILRTRTERALHLIATTNQSQGDLRARGLLRPIAHDQPDQADHRADALAASLHAGWTSGAMPDRYCEGVIPKALRNFDVK